MLAADDRPGAEHVPRQPARTGVYEKPGPTRVPRREVGVQGEEARSSPLRPSPPASSTSRASTGISTPSTRRPARRSGTSSRADADRVVAGGRRTGLLYFVSSVGALVALDVATGKPKWVFAAEYERKFEAKGLHGYPSPAQTIPDAWDIFTSSPAVRHRARSSSAAATGTSTRSMQETGLLQWKFGPGTSCTRRRPSPATRSTSGAGTAPSTPSTRTRARRGGRSRRARIPAIHNQVGFQSSPAVVDGTVYVGCRDAHVYALDAATGRKKWDYPTSKSWVIGTPAVARRHGLRRNLGQRALHGARRQDRAPAVQLRREGATSSPRPPSRAISSTSAITTASSTRSIRRRRESSRGSSAPRRRKPTR